MVEVPQIHARSLLAWRIEGGQSVKKDSRNICAVTNPLVAGWWFDLIVGWGFIAYVCGFTQSCVVEDSIGAQAQ